VILFTIKRAFTFLPMAIPTACKAVQDLHSTAHLTYSRKSKSPSSGAN